MQLGPTIWYYMNKYIFLKLKCKKICCYNYMYRYYWVYATFTWIRDVFSILIKGRNVDARTLIFHMKIRCDKTFSWVPLFFFTQWPWSWSLPIFWIFNLANNFWTVSVVELWYFTFPMIRPICGYHYFILCDLDLGVGPIFWEL